MYRPLIVILLVFTGLLCHASPYQTEWGWTTTTMAVHPEKLDAESSLWIFNWIPPGTNGDGAGWWTEIYNFTDGTSTAGSTEHTLGWFDEYGYLIDSFAFTATEGDVVEFRLYNATTLESATFVANSFQITLPTVSELPFPDDLTVTFPFQAIPEPATTLLLILGGVACWLLRREKG